MLIANKSNDKVMISVIGEIMSENEWTFSDALYLRDILDAAGDMPIDLWVSSPGGSLDAALAMRAMLSAHAGGVSVHTAGIVASAATLLLCLPNAEVTAERGSVFMIHTARMGAAGDAREMRKAADALDACDDEIMQVYKLRLKCGDDELRDMMAAETWLSSDEAAKLGLVDKVAEASSGEFIAEPKNPDPIPDASAEAVTARLAPNFEALSTRLDGIKAIGETRMQALCAATDDAVASIVDASNNSVASITGASDQLSASVSAEIESLRSVFEDMCARMTSQIEALSQKTDECSQKYTSLDETLSRVYALHSGDVSGGAVHDEQRNKSTFKLNI